jgi:hypothetical protein
MKPWHFAVVGLALLATAGCRSDPAVAVLERELRLKEDEIYRLRAAVEDLQDSGTCQQQTSASKRDREDDATSPAAGGSKPRTRNGSASEPDHAAPPRVEVPGQPTSEVPDIIRGGGKSTPSGVPEVPEHLRGPSPPAKPAGPGAGKSGEPATPDGPSLSGPLRAHVAGPYAAMREGQVDRGSSIVPAGDSRQVAAIALNRMLTGGINAGDRSGDQGVLAVIEPRDAQGHSVDAPADMNVVVIDPALEGDAARVARWDFSADQIALMFRRTGAGQAIHVEAPWPGDPPVHNKLHLFVRYTTADGRKLESNQPIEIALPGEKPSRWTPAEASARSGGAASEGDPPALLNAPLHRTQAPAARVPGPPPRGSSGSAASKPQRPTWSPERQ